MKDSSRTKTSKNLGV